VPGQGLQVGADQRVDALLLVVGVEVAQPDLHVRKFGDGLLFRRVDAASRAVVPVDPQQSAVREDGAGPVDEGLDEALGVEVEGATVLGAGDESSRGRVEVSRVDEDRMCRGRLRDLGEHAREQLVGAVDAGAQGRQVVVHRTHCPGGHAANTTGPKESPETPLPVGS
jgi:hypothetical protein